MAKETLHSERHGLLVLDQAGLFFNLNYALKLYNAL